MSDIFRHLDCVCCRSCGLPTKVAATKIVHLNGVRTRSREHVCSNERCGATYATAECPIEVALDVWECEA